MDIRRNLLTVNPFSRPGKILRSVKGIVMHWVANPGTTALQNRNYFESLKNQTPGAASRYASAHFIIDISGEILQCIPLAEMACHVGAKLYTPDALSRLGPYPNDCMIGIELCHPTATGEFSPETWSAAAGLAAMLTKRFALDPLADIWTHHGITQKRCPKYFVDHPRAFERFKLDVHTIRGETLKE
jgi:N-acetylmuramoyl-L-alanine amidase